MGIGGEIVARLTAVVGVDTKELKAGLAEAEAETKKSGDRMGKALGAAQKVAAVGLVAVGAAAFEGVKGAIELQKKMAALNKVMSNAHVSAKDAGEAQEYLEQQSNKTGFAIGDLTDGFGKAIAALGDYKTAQKEQALAENIARASGESFAIANKQAIKVFEGKNTALSKLGVTLGTVNTAEVKAKTAVDKHNYAVEKQWKAQKLSGKALDDAKTKLKLWDKAQMDAAKHTDLVKQGQLDAKQATDKYKGSTEAYAQTLGGKLQITENKIHNLLDTLGGKLLPVLTSVFGFLADHTNVLIIVAGAIGAIWAVCVAVTAVTKAWAAATKIATAAQWLWNAAMDANPIGLVVLALVALVAGIVIAYKHFGGFRKVVNELWGKLKEGWSWIKSNWPLLLGILTGPIGLAVVFIATHFDKVKQYGGDLLSWFKALPGKIGDALGSVGGAISGAFRGIWGGVESIVKNGLNAAIIDPLNSLINKAVSLEKKIPGSPDLGIGDNPIPRLARGGFVPGRPNGGRDSVLALLAPGELVLNRRQQGQLASLLGLGGDGYGRGGGVTVNQTIITATDDQGVHMRRAKFAAMSAFGAA